MIKNIMKNIGTKPSITEYVKALDTVNKLEAAYKKQKEDYDYTQRVKENGGDVSLMFPNNVKPKDLSENEDYLKAKNIIQSMELKDSAPEAKKDVLPSEVEEKEEVKETAKDKAENPYVKKLAEQNEKFLNRRDELIAKGKLTEKEAEEMKNLTNIIQMNTSAMLNLTGNNKKKKPLTSPDLIPSYDDFNPYRD